MPSEPWASPDGVAAAVAVLALAGTGAGAYLRLFVGSKFQELRDHNAAQDKDAARTTESLKAAFIQIDKLKEEKASYITREEHTQYRAELMVAVKEISATVIASSAAIREDIRDLGERVSKVEAARE